MIARCKSSCCPYDPFKENQTCCYFCRSQSECVAETPDVTCIRNPKRCFQLVTYEGQE